MAERADAGTRKQRAKQWTAEEARAVFRDLERSGLSAFAFARREGLSYTRLSYRRKRLADGSSDKVGFVAVPVVGSESGGGIEQIELECAGVTMRVRALDVEKLARLIVALSRRAREC